MTLLGNAFVCLSDTNVSLFDGSLQEIVRELVPGWIALPEYIPWLGAIFGSILVGLSGVLPLVIPIDQTDNLKQGDGANKLKTLLSFAVGALLGDIFLHSLPEIWAYDMANNGGHRGFPSGVWILAGLTLFVTAEKFFTVIEKVAKVEKTIENTPENNNTKGVLRDAKRANPMTGYLNLLANTMDNFTHGLSLGGAFQVSLRLGLLTTFAILIHEIPHEVGDFAILLKSGFTRRRAAIFQLCTALGGLAGAMLAIEFGEADNAFEARSSWIIPFTAGSFLHISLVTVLPDLLKEEDPKESVKQLLAIILGIVIMAVVTNVSHEQTSTVL